MNKDNNAASKNAQIEAFLSALYEFRYSSVLH